LEKIYNVSHLKPTNCDVLLEDGAKITVPVFDAKSMILNLITNPVMMKGTNIADGYDIFTSDVDNTNPTNGYYGEVHTGDQWLTARDKYCNRNNPLYNDMPVGLIIFGDKSHTDLHGALSLTPIYQTINTVHME